MGKKISLGCIMICMMGLLSGCSIPSTGLTEGELDQVAEYTAKLLLKHTRGYEPNLLEQIEVKDDPSLVKEEFEVLGEVEKPKEEPKEEIISKEKPSMPETAPSEGNMAEKDEETDEKETEDKKEEAKAKSLSELYEIEGIEVLYGGSGEYKKFPENEGYFSLVAPDGMKLFVTKFIVKNKSKSRKHFVHGENIRYQLIHNGGKTYRPSVTLLENDMKFLDLEIDKGNTTKGVVVFNIPKEVEIKNAKLKIFGNNLEYEISVSQ